MTKKSSGEENLVIEQKGWRFFAIGLIAATFLSLTFRAVFSPRRIQFEIERAVETAHTGFETQLQGSRLSLSDGWWPRLAIVIDTVTLKSSDPCYFQVGAQIKNLILPINLWSLLDRTLSFEKIVIDDLQLRLKMDRQGCGQSEKVDTGSTANTADSFKTTLNKSTSIGGDGSGSKPMERPPLVQTVSLESGFLRHLEIRRAQIFADEWPQFKLDLNDTEIELPFAQNTRAQLSGQLELNSVSGASQTPLSSLQGIHAQLKIDSDENQAQIKVNGAWREGQVSLEGLWSFKEKALHASGDFRQIPWGQLILMAPGLTKSNLLTKTSQAWVNGHWTFDQDSKTKTEILMFKEAKVEGEFGDFIADLITLKKEGSESSWKLEPMTVQFKNIDLELLNRNRGGAPSPKIFRALGVFDGQAQVNESGELDLNGVWKDLALSFMNNGHEEFQKIDSIQVRAQKSQDHWSVDFSNILLAEGQFKGDIQLKGSFENQTFDVESEFSELKFNSTVEKLMTWDGEASTLEGRIHFNVDSGEINQAEGFLKADVLTINKTHLENARIDFENKQGSTEGRLQILRSHWEEVPLPYFPYPLPEETKNLQINNIYLNFEDKADEVKLTLQKGLILDPKLNLEFEILRSKNKALSGHFKVQKDKKIQLYRLKGTEKKPQWD